MADLMKIFIIALVMNLILGMSISFYTEQDQFSQNRFMEITDPWGDTYTQFQSEDQLTKLQSEDELIIDSTWGNGIKMGRTIYKLFSNILWIPDYTLLQDETNENSLDSMLFLFLYFFKIITTALMYLTLYMIIINKAK